MRPSLARHAAVQAGLFTHAQALAAGYTPREIRALIRPGAPWVVVRRGVMVEREFLDALELRERWLLRDRAALILSAPGSVLSHDSAGRVLQLNTLDVEVPGSHTTRRGRAGSSTSAGITRHRDLQPLCVEVVGDLPATSYARTALDLGRLHGFKHGLVAVDSARNQGVPLADLEAELDRMRRHPHIAQARAAVDASDPGAESPLETLARQLLVEMDIGPVETQFAVRIADGRTVWGDLRVGCHLFECHGDIKLLRPDQGGVSEDPAGQAKWQRQRESELRAEGLGVSAICWTDLFGASRERAKVRLTKEFRATAASVGVRLPEHLRRYADTHCRQRRSGLWVPWALRQAS